MKCDTGLEWVNRNLSHKYINDKCTYKIYANCADITFCVCVVLKENTS